MASETNDAAIARLARLARENTVLRLVLDAHRQAIQALYAVVPAEAQTHIERQLAALEAACNAKVSDTNA